MNSIATSQVLFVDRNRINRTTKPAFATHTTDCLTLNQQCTTTRACDFIMWTAHRVHRLVHNNAGGMQHLFLIQMLILHLNTDVSRQHCFIEQARTISGTQEKPLLQSLLLDTLCELE